MPEEFSSGETVKLPDWQQASFAALAEALAAEDSERCRALVTQANERDAALAAQFASSLDFRVDCRALAEHLAHFRGAVGSNDGELRFLDALRLRCELTEFERRFDQALDDAKLTALAEFAAGAGHEMNNPLAVISGRAQLLLRGETDESRRADLALIKAQATRVHEMIADLMLFARPPAPVKRPIDLVTLIRATVEKLRPAASQKAAEVVLTLPDAAIVRQVDEALLSAALRALVENAIQAVDRGGHVSVSLLLSGEQIELAVSDDGPGISATERSLIFDPYYSGRQAGRGLGMGLCKAWRIVQMHGGSLTVEDAARGGARYTIIL